MKTLGVQELTERINEILRMIKEDGETVEVIDDGEVIAKLIPGDGSKQPTKRDRSEFLAMLNRHAAEIGAHITEKSVDAVQIVREGRREL